MTDCPALQVEEVRGGSGSGEGSLWQPGGRMKPNFSVRGNPLTPLPSPPYPGMELRSYFNEPFLLGQLL